MPVTFCFENAQRQNVCSTGFPMGCYVTKDGKPKDGCVLDVINTAILCSCRIISAYVLISTYSLVTVRRIATTFLIM